MEFCEITSKDNPLIKLCCALQSSSKKRREYGLFVIEGLRICKDAYENNIKFDKLIVTDFAYKKFQNEIRTFAENSLKCYTVSDSLFKKIGDTENPQGIMAIAKMPDYSSCDISDGKYIAVENLSDPSNLGAISRSAEALGISGIIMSKNGCDPFSPKSIRASMGTLLRMPLYICDDVLEFIKDKNLRSFACVVDNDAEKINSISFKNGDVVIIGNEANGLSDKTKENSDTRITIPMLGRAESLNAAAAASIAMWEMMR